MCKYKRTPYGTRELCINPSLFATEFDREIWHMSDIPASHARSEWRGSLCGPEGLLFERRELGPTEYEFETMPPQPMAWAE